MDETHGAVMTKPKIVRYRHPEALFSEAMNYGAEALVVTAQKGMARLYEKRRLTTPSSPKGVFVFALLKELLPDWFSSERSLLQHILLSGLIDSAWEQSGQPGGEALRRAFRNNRGEVLQGLRLLVEIGVTPCALPESTPEEALFACVYEAFIANEDSGVPLLMKELATWSDPSTFARRIARAHADPGKPPIGRFSAVFLQGFYYVRPLQARLLDALAGTGVPVAYLNAFEPEHAECYEVWERNPRFAGLRVDPETVGNPVSPGTTERILKFGDLFSMVAYVRKHVRSIVPMAPFAETTAKMLEPFFPRKEEKARLLSYPVGRYVWGLYSMWDPIREELVLDTDTVRRCLATGWADESAEDPDEPSAFETFDKVEDYFSDCRTIEDWEERLERVEEIYKYMEAQEEPSRWENYLRWVLGSIDVFNTPVRDIRRLIAALRVMRRAARELFSYNDKNVDLLEHFERLRNLLRERAGRVRVEKEEEAVLETFLQRLNAPSASLVKCPLEHIASAVKFYLGGRRPDEEEGEAELGPVRSLSDIEAVLVESKYFGGDRELFLCCCDGQSLPGRAGKLLWPLTESFLERTQLTGAAARRREELFHRLRCNVLANRYLFHAAQTHSKLVLSWIAKLNGKDVSPSVYLQRLAARGVKVEVAEDLLVRGANAPAIEAEPVPDDRAITQAVRTTCGETCPLELRLAEKACPHGSLRLWYDCGLAASSGYSDRFALNFLLSQAIVVRMQRKGESADKAAGVIFWHYPALSASAREQCKNFGASHYKRLSDDTLEHCGKLTGGADPLVLLERYIPFRAVLDGFDVSESGEEACRYCQHANRCFARYRY